MSFKSTIKTVATLGKGIAKGLTELEAGSDPIALFAEWLRDARESGLLLPEAMTVATATPDGKPSARMMLLKEADASGFVFFTNYDSRKSDELLSNPHAALVFHWPVLERQVRVEGDVERLPAEDSETYFRTRPRGSQVSAWASEQSRPLASREELEKGFKDVESKYDDADVPLPPFWGGFRLRPQAIEFWQGRINRLHDRLRYLREGAQWRVERLYP